MDKKVLDKLRNVMDPELYVNIVDLGLVYSAELKNDVAEITMTLTTPGCPMSPVFEAMIKNEVGKLAGVREIHVHLTFDPPWSPTMMSDEVRVALGF